MIIVAPTGFYDLSNVGSVTFHISNNLPPRSNLTYPKISSGIVSRKRAAPDLSNSDVGGLVFSVSKSSRSIAGNSSRQYEIGQILEFTDSITKTTSPMKVSSKTEIQHNLNKFDYNSMGVDDSEASLLGELSHDVKVVLENKLNQLKQSRANAEVVINTKQKLINEINRNIDALEVVISIDSDEDLLNLMEKLKNKRDAAYIIRDAAIEDANTYAAESEVVVDKLRTVATVVK